MKHAELIEALRQATGPDRELDARIWLAVTPGATRKATTVNHHTGPYVIDETRDATGRLIIVPELTGSIDAALTLVPTGLYGFAQPWFYNEYSRLEKRCVLYRATVLRPVWDKATPVDDDWFERWESGNAATPAIALCIAALTAMAGEDK
jgi:hypothetical protein